MCISYFQKHQSESGNYDDDHSKRSGVAGLYVDDDAIYFSYTVECKYPDSHTCTEECHKKYRVQKCNHNRKTIATYPCFSFVRGIGKDQEGNLYVLCSGADSQVFKLDSNLKPLCKTHDRSAEYFGEAFGMLVTPDWVFVCSPNRKKVCILDLCLNHHFNLSSLKYGPNGIAKQNDRYFVVSDHAVTVIDINFETKSFKENIFEDMIMNDGSTESFYQLRGICATKEHLFVTEKNMSTGGRLMCLKFDEGQMKCVDAVYCAKNCQSCSTKCCPVVITHNNGKIHYCQGSYGEMFHILQATLNGTSIESKKLFDVS